MRTLLALALLSGCHARFKREARALDAVRVEVSGDRRPNVDLGDLYSLDPSMGGLMADSYAIPQLAREAQLQRVVAAKVDPARMNAAFAYGLRETLGPGPPFAAVDEAPAVLRLEVRRWGVEVNGFPAPATFAYRVRVRGEVLDRTFYRARFQCIGDAGPARWVQSVPWGANADRLEGVPSSEVQETFDRAAYQCGRQLAARLRVHAG